MTITFTSDQERAIHEAIRNGVVGSVDEFIESAIEALTRHAGFDPGKAALAVALIRELRKGVHLDRCEMSIREMAHLGHRY